MSHFKKLSFSCAAMIDVSTKQKSVMDPKKKETLVDLCHLVAGQASWVTMVKCTQFDCDMGPG